MKNPFPEVKWNDILNQIASKAKAKDEFRRLVRTQMHYLSFKNIHRTDFL